MNGGKSNGRGGREMEAFLVYSNIVELSNV